MELRRRKAERTCLRKEGEGKAGGEGDPRKTCVSLLGAYLQPDSAGRDREACSSLHERYRFTIPYPPILKCKEV